MDDIVQECKAAHFHTSMPLLLDAAEEITRLRKENEALRTEKSDLAMEMFGVVNDLEDTERERDAAQAQVAVLRKHLQDAHDTIEEWGMANATETNYSSFPIRAALSDTSSTAEAHDKRVRAEGKAEGLEEAAGWHDDQVRKADEILLTGLYLPKIHAARLTHERAAADIRALSKRSEKGD